MYSHVKAGNDMVVNEIKEKIKTITGTKATVMKYAYAKIFTKDLDSVEWMNTGL